MGRINHTKLPNGQWGADPDRVEALKARCPLLYLEMEPGKTMLLLFREFRLSKFQFDGSVMNRFFCY